MMPRATQDRRGGARYLIEGQPVTITVRELYQEDQTIGATVVNLSQRGAKLIVPSNVATSKTIQLKLSIQKIGLEFYVSGDVVWTSAVNDGEWLLGCTLDPPLPAGVFDAIAEDGRLDRRFDPRFGDKYEFIMQSKVTNVQHAVRLRNYSKGGFCVLSASGIDPGQPFQLQSRELSIQALTQWQLKLRDGFLIGCSFENADDFDQFANLTQL